MNYRGGEGVGGGGVGSYLAQVALILNWSRATRRSRAVLLAHWPPTVTRYGGVPLYEYYTPLRVESLLSATVAASCSTAVRPALESRSGGGRGRQGAQRQTGVCVCLTAVVGEGGSVRVEWFLGAACHHHHRRHTAAEGKKSCTGHTHTCAL